MIHSATVQSTTVEPKRRRKTRLFGVMRKGTDSVPGGENRHAIARWQAHSDNGCFFPWALPKHSVCGDATVRRAQAILQAPLHRFKGRDGHRLPPAILPAVFSYQRRLLLR